MHLTRHTDYALRLLIQLAGAEDHRASIAAVAQEQAISRTHLMKVANGLVRAGFLEASRGRGGGIRLARAPGEIGIAAVVRAMEPGCKLVSCVGCRLMVGCSLPAMLDEAMAAFHASLGQYTLADAVAGGAGAGSRRPAPAQGG